MNMEYLSKKLSKLAESGQCNKRKVAAIIVDKDQIVGEGINYNYTGGACEDENGNTLPSVIHAEVDAIDDARNYSRLEHCTIYVTHPPCENCRKAIADVGIKDIVVVDAFLKFDKDKPKYSLIPTKAMRAMADVLTYGAKKYKPNNWKNVDNKSRYVDALYRHLESYRSGEKLDEESKLPHLAHAITNVAFLIYLEEKDND